MAHHRTQLWILHPRCSLGRYNPPDRYADDTQNLRLRMDGSYRIRINEKSHCQINSNLSMRTLSTFSLISYSVGVQILVEVLKKYLFRSLYTKKKDHQGQVLIRILSIIQEKMPIESGQTKKNATWTKVCVAFFFFFIAPKLIRSNQRKSDFRYQAVGEL